MVAPTFHYLTDVHFEPGSVRHAAAVLGKLGVARPLIVSDTGVAAAGILSRLAGLEPAARFLDVATNPTEANVLAGAEAYRANGCDGVLAVGGGSPIDCAKAIAIAVSHPPPLEAFAFLRGGMERISAAKPPVVAVPTTAGTGSEVGRGALITFASGRKLAILSARLIPQAAICDPELTLGLPAALTAATGMDAISHCVETFLSPRLNPVADAIGLDGLVRAVRHIRAAVNSPGDLAARSEMLMAALQGGLTFQKGLGAVHSLSHALGSLERRRLHHGTLNAVLLPHVLRFNAEACGAKMKRLAQSLQLPSALKVPQYFSGLAADLGLPPRLRDLGVPWEEVEALSGAAFEDHCGATNPRPLSVDSCRELFLAAF